MTDSMPFKNFSQPHAPHQSAVGLSTYKNFLLLPTHLVNELAASAKPEGNTAAPATDADAADTWPKEFDEILVEPKAEEKLDPNWLFDEAELQKHASRSAIRWGTRKDIRECYPTMRVYREADVDHALKTIGMKITDRDEKKTANYRLEVMKEAGSVRRVAQFDPALTLHALDLLDHDFPNFAEVTAYVRGEIALGRADDNTARPSPILLDGPPGCGKTEYARRLATVFGLPPEHFHVVNVATLQTSAGLCGSSSHYANTKTGLIFDQLVGTRYANPVVLLDEIDKASGDERFSPASVLYGLLSDNARHFADEAVPAVPIDASRIIWILTSNYADTIEAALRSRLLRFDIAMPSPDQSRIIVANMFRDMQAVIKGMQHLQLSDGAVDRLIVCSPRKIRTALKCGAGQALLGGRSKILCDDILVEKAKTPIGF